MKRANAFVSPVLLLSLICTTTIAAAAERFTPLALVPNARIIDSSEAYPGGRYQVTNMIDGWGHSEYSSSSKGTETFISFDFGEPTLIAGFRHVDRRDPATVDAAQLTFSNDRDFKNVIATAQIDHVGTSGGITFAALPKPVVAQFVRWNVTALGPKRHGTVGGAEIGFFTAGPPDDAPVRDRIEPRSIPALINENGRLVQPLEISVHHNYAEPTAAVLKIVGFDSVPVDLKLGRQIAKMSIPEVKQETTAKVILAVDGKPVVTAELLLKPVRHWEMHFLPHSHVDIGYTHVQTEVERAHWKYFEMAIEIAKKTADYPPEAQFKWNSEVMWAVDSYLKQASDEKRAEFIQAVRQGQIHLDGLYGNELTALCRPEELMRLTDCAQRIAAQYDLTIDTAMISDVPGYTWGIVPALAAGGVKYFSIGPNHVHRIGYTLDDWGDRPFWWVSPSGQDKVLCWVAGKAYSWFHNSRVGTLTRETDPQPFFDYLDELAQKDFPYDIVQIRYSIGGDNGPPDAELSEFVKEWNEKYTWPRMIISTTSRMMHQFDRRYGKKLPEVRGDFTPYWEDGAGSSAKETGISRTAAERLVQAEALWAMLRPKNEYPADDFYAAWRNIMLYSEHTWGAHCSISRPDSQFTLDQWAIKQAYAVDAEKQSKDLLDAAFAERKASADSVKAVDVFNTTSWSRSELVTLPAGAESAGSLVKDSDGTPVPSQLISMHRGQPRLVFLAQDVPPMGAERFFIESGQPAATGSAKLEGNALSNGRIRVEVDETSGQIKTLACQGIPVNLAEAESGLGLNSYAYVAGRDRKTVAPRGPVRIEPGETGPLTASLVVISEGAPGCRRLISIIRLVDGADHVDVFNMVDKEKVLTKEAVHFGFGFNVPEGVMRMDMPWSIVRPEIDQLPGACKNYFTVGRWVDVSNDDFGATWVTRDAPLVEVGGITVDVSSPFEPGAWIRKLEPTQTFYSYVMNNYWETNYKASQEGPTMFRYSIRPHKKFDPAAAARFGIEQSQPLIAVPVNPETPVTRSLLTVEPKEVVITSLKPSLDKKALILRLFNAGNKPAAAKITWSDPAPRQVTLTKVSEAAGEAISGPIQLPPLGIATLRAE
jgi:alpha-mannosidase